MTTESKEPNQPTTSSNANERCEEVQAIVDRMPTKGATYVAVAVTVMVIIAFVLSCVISYPDTVDGNISLTAGAAPVRLVAKVDGQLEFYHKDGDMVKQNDLLASIQNAAETKEVLALEKVLSLSFCASEDSMIEIHKDAMGELSGSFNDYLLALSLYKQNLNSDLYLTVIRNLNSQIASDRDILRHVDADRKIRQEALDLSSKKLKKDSLLLTHKAITEEDLDQQRTQYLNSSESYWSTESNRSTVLGRIDQNEIEIRRTRIEQTETIEKLLAEVQGKRNYLLNEIRVWKERYLLISPFEGRLEYLGFWRNHGFVQSGAEVLTVVPKQQELFGEVRIPSIGAGKVKVGQPVNVKVNNYPYDEYGYIKGKVTKLSKMPSLVTTKDGDVDSYLAIVHFPDGAVTNYGILLNVDFESKGTAEIITKDKRLIERLFDNLKSLGTK